MKITWADYRKLTPQQHELLRVYSSRSWEDRQGVLNFEIASYRVEEIMAAGVRAEASLVGRE